MRRRGIRDQIRAEMLERARLHPLASPITAKEIQALHPGLPLSTIYYHVAAIRAEADAIVSWNLSNSDTGSVTA